MQPWPVDQGDSPTFTATLNDSDGNAYTGYAGTEALTVTVWPGDEQAPIAGVGTPSWLDASAGTIDVVIDGSKTSAMVPGRYVLTIEVDGQIGFKCWLDVSESDVSGATARTAHVTLRHLRKHYRNVDKLLSGQGFADDPTALEARADAWDWFVDLLHRHYRGNAGLSTDFAFVPGVSFQGSYGLQLYRDGRRSADLQTWLDAGRLDLTTPVLDAMALHALAQILGGMVSNSEDKGGYRDLAADFALRAETRVSTLVAEIDSDGDGTNDVFIRLDVADTLEG